MGQVVSIVARRRVGQRSHEGPEYLPILEGDLFGPLAEYARSVRKQIAPEKLLMLAVLEQAIQEWRESADSVNARRLQTEARQWMISGEREHPFSFVNICEQCGAEPDAVREALGGWEDAPRPATGRRLRIARR